MQAVATNDLMSMHGLSAEVAPPTLTVVFLVNGTAQSAMGVRARSFAAQLAGDYAIHILYRDRNKLAAIARFYGTLLRLRPRLVHVFDMAYSGVIAALLYKVISQAKVVVDTGDAISELARSVGRSALGCWLTKCLEEVSLHRSNFVVVRGTHHKTLLATRGVRAVEVIPDGVDTTQFKPAKADAVRRQYGLQGSLVIGTLGTSIWNERLQTCYGWEMLEALRILKSRPVRALMIGGGSGSERLKARAQKWGLEDRIVFLGYVPYEQLPAYLNAMDVCLSKQTNDVVGRVRTTGKLPLYLACGKYVLATRVGEAARVLPTEMLIDYEGSNDPSYARRLAERIAYLLDHPDLLDGGSGSVDLARRYFDYPVLARRMRSVYDRMLEAVPAGNGMA